MFVPVSISLGRVPKLPNGRHILSGGVQIYVLNGAKHRENGPAEVRPDGYKAWFKKGLRHRDGGPAVIYPDGTQEYWSKGKLLRRISADGTSSTITRRASV